MPSANADLAGVITPLVTPLTTGGEVDVKALESFVDYQLEAGVNGLFVLGSSGEAPYLTDAQRHTVVATVTRSARGRVPVLAGALDMTAPRVITQAQLAKDAGADFAVIAPPNYAIASDDEVVEHYRTVGQAVGIPLVAYDIPSRSHRRLGLEIIPRLAKEQLVRAVKDSSGDVIGMRKLLGRMPDDSSVGVFIGSELAVDLGVFIGCVGAVPGLANVDPHGYVRIHELARAGKWDEARKQQARLTKLYRSIEIGRPHGLGVDAAAYGAFKTALLLRGIIPSDRTARPQTPLPAPVRAELEGMLSEAGLL